MLIRVEGVSLPGSSCGPSPERPDGYSNIHVGVQRRGRPAELLGLVRGDADQATWVLDAALTRTPDGGADLKGPYIQGPPGGRFIYLSWDTVDAPGTFTLFRRAKLLLGAVPAEVLSGAADQGTLVARVVMTDAKGNPACASLRPPFIEWSAAPC